MCATGLQRNSASPGYPSSWQVACVPLDAMLVLQADLHPCLAQHVVVGPTDSDSVVNVILKKADDVGAQAIVMARHRCDPCAAQHARQFYITLSVTHPWRSLPCSKGRLREFVAGRCAACPCRLQYCPALRSVRASPAHPLQRHQDHCAPSQAPSRGGATASGVSVSGTGQRGTVPACAWTNFGHALLFASVSRFGNTGEPRVEGEKRIDRV